AMSACCEERAFALDELVQGELALTQAAQVRAHAAACPGCAAELRLLCAEQAALRSRREPAAAVVVPLRPASFAEVRQRIGWLRAGDRATARHSALLSGLATAAALLLAVLPARGPGNARASSPAAAQSSAFIPWCAERPDPVGSAESAFAACLLATPRAPPD